jgi:ATP-binding cassette subfamily B protein
MVRGLWQLQPGLSVLVGLCVVVAALVPVASLLVTGAIVGGLEPAVEAGSGSGAAHHVELLVGVLAALLVLQQVLTGVQEAIVPSLGRSFECTLRERVMASTMAPSGVSHLQDPDVVSEMSAATTVGTAVFGPGVAVFSMPVIFGTLVTGFGMAVVLGAFRWWLGVLLAAAWLWAREMRRRDVVEQTRELFSPPAGTRRQAYFRDLTMTPDAAKEIRVFGLSGWVVDNFRRHWLAAMQQVWAGRRERRPPMVVGLIVLVAANVLTFVVDRSRRDERRSRRGSARNRAPGRDRDRDPGRPRWHHVVRHGVHPRRVDRRGRGAARGDPRRASSGGAPRDAAACRW